MMKFNAAQFNVIKKAADFRHFKAVCHLTLNQMSGNGYAKERPFLCRASSAALSLAPTVSARRRPPPARSDTESLEAVYGLAPILFSGKTEKFFIFLRARGEKGFGATTADAAMKADATDAAKKVRFDDDTRGVAAKKMNGENTELGSSSPIYTVPKSIVYHCRDFRDGFGAAIFVRLRQKNHQSTQEKTNER